MNFKHNDNKVQRNNKRINIIINNYYNNNITLDI